MNSERTPSPRHLRVTFLAEQNGAPERELKRRLIEILEPDATVRRAYLARVAYPETGEAGVALCLPSGVAAPKALVRDISAVFSELFGIDQHLDVVFVTEDDEKRLAEVCRPFFSQ